MVIRKGVVCALITLSAVAGACSPSTTNSQSRPKSTAKISILAPKSGATISGTNVLVTLELDGGTITKVVTTHITPNVGHIHLRLDGQTITLLGSLSQTLPHVSKGMHVLETEFVAADHGPWNPRILSDVTFTAT